jgi:hypothetical protein
MDLPDKNSVSSRQRWNVVLLYSPILLGILIMLPRLLSPQFGLLDDGNTLRISQGLAGGSFDLQQDLGSGRWRPVYWLFYSLPYLIAGANPLMYFRINTIELCLITAGLIHLVHAISGSRLQAFLCGLFFVTAGPIIENFYTLSKPEAPQMLFLVAALGFLWQAAAQSGRRGKLLFGLAGVVAFVLAVLMKETTLVMLGISAAWLAISLFFHRKNRMNRQVVDFSLYLFGASLIGVAAFLLPRLALSIHSAVSGTYSSHYGFSITDMLATAIRWTGWLVRDFAYLLPLVLLAIILWKRRRVQEAPILVAATLWMIAWVGIYLPWSLMTEYYMLPFALGAAVFAAVVIGQAMRVFSGVSRRTRLPVVLCLGLTGILLLGVFGNNFTTARIQLLVDKANTETLAYLARQAPLDSTVYINIQISNEYVDEIGMHLAEIWDRADLHLVIVDITEMPVSGETPPGVFYIIAPYTENQPLMTVRMGVVESSLALWSQALEEYVDVHSLWQVQAVFGDQFHNSIFDLPRLFCPFIKTRAFCATPAPLIDVRPFSYGWTVYKLVLP